MRTAQGIGFLGMAAQAFIGACLQKTGIINVTPEQQFLAGVFFLVTALLCFKLAKP